jgi:hypothetical protein
MLRARPCRVRRVTATPLGGHFVSNNPAAVRSEEGGGQEESESAPDNQDLCE